MKSACLAAEAALLSVLFACASPQASWQEGAETPASPQRPTYSSSTVTTASGTLELEAGLNTDRGDGASTPATLKYGIDERMEVSLGFTPIVAADAGGTGFGDLLLGYRQRLTELNEDDLSVAWMASLKLPTANEDKGLGTGETDVFVAGIGMLPVEEWMAVGFAQLGLVGDPYGSGMDGQIGLAGAMSRPLEGGAGVFGELAGVFTPDQNYDSLFTTLGGTWSPTPGLVFDMGFVIGLTSDAPDFQFVIGLTRNFGSVVGYAPRRR